MTKIARKRCGYLWLTDEEEKKLFGLIKATSAFKTGKALQTKADFVRVATLAMGELIRNKKVNLSNLSQDEAVAKIVETFSK